MSDVKGPSKAQLKKEAKKAEKAAKKAEYAAAAPAPKPSTPQAVAAATTMDPDAMFKKGFLNDVYHEREGKVIARFPPEPNGFLHIGHAKAIAVNFGFARFHGGECYLRFDDTNPEAEEQIYFDAIQDIIKWLGFTPKAVTYSSDHFDKLYELAEFLIKKDGAYVCHCADTEVKLQRGGENHGPRYACPHRNRPTEESLTEFRAMRDGKYKPKEAFLRMKQDLEDGNPQMWDLTAYRVLNAPHHRTGDKWRIYPTYDFTHCLCDSFEEISHSLCTTEFILSRQSYEWLCDAVEIYKPMQREYGRLKITGTLLSKRKIAKLVNQKIVRGWDDPRLFTLIGLRRRGIPPEAMLSFVNELGVTTAVTNIQLSRLDNSVRKYLELNAPRLMLVLDPVLVIIDDLPDDYYEELEFPFFPKDPTSIHKVPLTKKVYIERSDFRVSAEADFFRLTMNQPVGLLKLPYPIKATSYKADADGRVLEIRASYVKPDAEDGKIMKPRTFIHWVSATKNITAEVRLFNALFKSEDPDAVPGGFLSDINPNSEDIYDKAVIEAGYSPEEHKRFQAMRVAYFAIDTDTTKDKLVLNRTVSLKEDSGKA